MRKIERPTGHTKAAVSVAIGGAMWALSGVSAQLLFRHDRVTPLFLVSARMLGAGIIVLGTLISRESIAPLRALLRSRGDLSRLLAFSIVGLIGVQYTYYQAIVYTNVVTATVMQYLGPLILFVYVAVRESRRFRLAESSAVALGVGGTILLLTNGDLTKLAIGGIGPLFGIASAITAAIYTYYPRGLIARYGARPVLGLAMFVGGLLTLPGLWSPFSVNVGSIGLLTYVIVFGTAISFALYLGSLRVLHAVETSVISCMEPLTATIVGVLFLRVGIGGWGLLGAAGVLVAVVMLAVFPDAPVLEAEGTELH
ncbi:MAG: DMT family transporter [Acidimicrobiales bacterium]